MSSGDKGQVGTESPRPLRKRRTRMANDKRIADDEFMAAAIGDVEWLRQSLREQKGKINFDKNVSISLHREVKKVRFLGCLLHEFPLSFTYVVVI